MNILMLAPQPFFTERGTPIAVDLVLRALSERGDPVDVLTYPMGTDVHYKNITLHRVKRIPFVREVRPGFSFRKLLYDSLMFLSVFKLVLRKRYHLVHAVEESVFIALVLKLLFKIPYVYDMDSSLSQQMAERYPRLFNPLIFLLSAFEGFAIKHAKAVVPVCEALQEDVSKYRPKKVLVLHDVSLLGETHTPPVEDLRMELGILGPLMMYVGNLEDYQGIDLLLESFSLALKRKPNGEQPASLVVIGGKQAEIHKYQAQTQKFGIQKQVFFVGPKPVNRLADYLAQADILVSPRIKGKNTPMKIYSYLDSGKALLATNLPTHTQVLNNQVAILADPSPEVFSHGVLQLVEDKRLRSRLGLAAKKLVTERHTYAVFSQNLNALYDWLKVEIGQSGQAGNGLADVTDLQHSNRGS